MVKKKCDLKEFFLKQLFFYIEEKKPKSYHIIHFFLKRFYLSSKEENNKNRFQKLFDIVKKFLIVTKLMNLIHFYVFYFLFISLKYNGFTIIFDYFLNFSNYKNIYEILKEEKKYYLVFVFEEIDQFDKNQNARNFFFSKKELVPFLNENKYDVVFMNKEFFFLRRSFFSESSKHFNFKKIFFQDFLEKAKENEKRFWYLHLYVIELKEYENKILLDLIDFQY